MRLSRSGLGLWTGGMLLSVAAGLWQWQRLEAAFEATAQAEAQQAVRMAVSQLRLAEYGLRGARGYVLGTGLAQLSRAGFEAYYQSRNLQQEFPGVLGFGLIRRVPQAQEAEYVARQQREGWPQFRIRMLMPHEGDRLPIEMVQPLDLNQAAIGLDVASEASRLRAAELAQASGEPAMTAPLSLVQSQGRSQGVLLMMPLAQQQGPVAQGFVYAPIQIDHLLQAAHWPGDMFGLRLLDVTEPGSPLPAFESAAEAGMSPPHGAALSLEESVYGRRWQFVLQPREALLAQSHASPPWLVAAVCALVALLVTALWELARRLRERARVALDERTRLSTLLDRFGDAAVALDLQGRVTLWNQAAAQCFGYTREQALGQRLHDLIGLPERQQEEARLIERALAGEQTVPFDTVRRHRDGTELALELSAGPVLDGAGQVVGVAQMLRSIAERQQARLQLLSHNETLAQQVEAGRYDLRRARTDLATVLDGLPSMVGAWDGELANRFANQAYATFFGKTPEQIRGMRLPELLGPALYEKNRVYIEGVLRGEPQSFEREIPSPDGSMVRYTLAHYLPQIEEGQVQGFYVLVHDVTPLKLAQRAHMETEALLQEVLVDLPLGISVWDAQARLTVHNLHWREVLELPDELLPGASGGMALTLPALLRHCQARGDRLTDLSGQEGAWDTLSAAGRPLRLEQQLDGRSLQVAAMPLSRGWRLVSWTDVSESKAIEAALRRSEAMLARSGELADVGGWELAWPEGPLIWSAQTSRIHGMPPGATPTLAQALDFFPPAARAQLHEVLAQAAAHGTAWDIELPMRRADGREIWVRSLGAPERENGRLVRMVGAFQDITARRRVEQEARQTGDWLRSALDAMGAGIAIYDQDDRLAFVSERYRALYQGLGEVLELGMRFEDIAQAMQGEVDAGLSPAAVAHQLAERLRVHRQGGEWVRRLPDGRTVRTLERPLAHDHVASFRLDISQLVQASEAAQAASQAKSRFLANTSHEIRTPLNAILGLAYMLARTELPAEQQQMVAQIRGAGRSLLRLINDVLDLSKIEAGQMELETMVFDLTQLMQSKVRLHGPLAAAKGLRLALHMDPGLPTYVSGDPTRLRQILNNLISNAIKFTERGEVSLSVARDGEEPWIRLTVKDTGMGIDPRQHARLFQPFTQADVSTTRRYGGTGLGLSIVLQLARLMGGELALQSELGQGSVFSVRLPLPAADVQELVAESEVVQPLRVLVADDDGDHRAALAQQISRMGWQVTAVEGGLPLVEAVLEAERRGQPLDALVVDWQMPDLDGLSALARLAQSLGPGRVPAAVLVAAQEVAGLQASPHAALAASVLVKPVNPSTLFNAVSQAVAANEATRGRLLQSVDFVRSDVMWLKDVRVLVADDSELNLEVVRHVLQLEGAQVATCSDGQQALAELQAHPGLYDAVLMDVQMPGMDGIEVTQRLRHELDLRDLPVIALTAGVQLQEREQAHLAGMDDFLGKPLDPPRLIRTLRRHVERYRGAGVAVVTRERPAGP